MFKRIGNLFSGFISLFVSGLERQNPEALLEVEKENLRRQEANFNQSLISHAGLCETLMSQVKKLESDEQDLTAKITANLRVGNKDVAGNYAMRLQTITRELETNRTQLAQAEKTYKDLIRTRDVAIKAAKTKIDNIKFSLSDLKNKRAQAELTEMASGMISQIGGAGDTLNRLEEMVRDETTKAAGRVRVAQSSLNTEDVDIKEAEQKALADQALADFAAKRGISLDGKTEDAAAAPARVMGTQAS